MDTGTVFLAEVPRWFRQQKDLADGAISQLSDAELFKAPDEESNSVAVIMKHMAGNLRSRFTDFLTGDGEKPDRHRDQEFVIEPSTSRQQIMEYWESGWRCLFAALDPLRPEDLLRMVVIRGESHGVIQAILRQLAHHSQHTGQIVFLAKHLRGKQWKTLSIPRGQSEPFNERMRS
jgi:hypothetical protein